MSERSLAELHKRELFSGVQTCKLDFCEDCVYGKKTRQTTVDEQRTMARWRWRAIRIGMRRLSDNVPILQGLSNLLDEFCKH